MISTRTSHQYPYQYRAVTRTRPDRSMHFADRPGRVVKSTLLRLFFCKDDRILNP